MDFYTNAEHGILIFCGLVIAWIVYNFKDFIIDRIISTVIYPVRNEQGQSISGPRWKYVDGQGIDKFLCGHEVSREWRQYGPVYRIWSGFIPEIVLTRPEDVKAFHTDSADHEKSTSSNAGWLFHQLLGDCMGLINGLRWKRVRANFHSYFIQSAVSQSAPEISVAVKEYIQQLRTKETKSLELHAANTARFPFMATAEYLYGPLTHEEKEELWTLGQRSLEMMGNVLAGGVYRFKIYPLLKPQTHRKFKKFEHDWTAFNERIYNTRRSHKPQPPIVEAWKAVENGEIPKSDAVQTMSEMLFANLDVSTHVLGWLIVFIGENASIQQQLRQEVAVNIDQLTEYCSKKDTLLHLCFLESLRLRPFTVFTIPESSPLVKVLGGYTVPPNTSVVVNTLAINHNVEFWGHDSLEFDPFRLQNVSAIKLRYNLFAFGFGSRKCLGQHFGEMMLKQFVCHVLQDYDMRLPEVEIQKGMHEKAGKNTWVPITDLRVTLTLRTAGTWIIDLAKSVLPTAELFGTDLAPQHFVPADKRPANVTLLTHSIFEPWPAHFQESFDVVHQRFVLTVASNETGQGAVKLLFNCVKPGGFIELHEGNMLSIQEGPEHKAFVKFRSVMVNAWAAIGNQPSPGSYLIPWLKEVGAVDIQEEVQIIKVGAAADDKEQGERAVIVLLQLLDGMKRMLGGKPGQPTNEEFDVLREDLETELNTVGNMYYYHLTWARKPEA